MSNPRTYRIYCYDSARQVVSADWIQATDDSDAIAKAEASGYGTKCEVWEGKRLVAELGGQLRTA
jgi:hypothetical protein